MGKDIKLEFRSFSISLYEENVKDLPLNKVELFRWFKSHSLSEIKEFPYWEYLCNEKENHFKLKRGNNNYWNVYKMENQDEIYFSFICNKGIGFINDFEQKLKKKLQQEELEERRKKYPYWPDPSEHDPGTGLM